MNSKSSLGKNAVYKVVLNLFNLLIPLFVGPYIAGLLDKNLYGIYFRFSLYAGHLEYIILVYAK